MKDIFSKSKPTVKPGSVESVKQSSDVAIGSKKDVQAFLGKAAVIAKPASDTRLIFALDATASRQATWDVASQLQRDMFASAQSLGGLQVQLSYFRGFAEFYKSEWHSNGDALMQKMAGLNCEAGATKIEMLLRHALVERRSRALRCVVFIGDAMEENLDRLAQLAGELGLLNVPLFMFQERNDPIARQAFLELSRLSGGAYSQFDSGSVAQLKALLEAVAVYAAGGLKALQDHSKHSPESVKLLLQQIKS